MKILFSIRVLGFGYFLSIVGDCKAFLIDAFGIKTLLLNEIIKLSDISFCFKTKKIYHKVIMQINGNDR